MSAVEQTTPDEQFAVASRRLEHIEMLLTLALAEPLRELRNHVGVGDEVSAEILRRTSDWTAAGELKRDVAKSVKASNSTLKNRFADLVKLGALESRGESVGLEYRNTFLLG